jgi:translation initiation factor 1A
MGKNTIGGKKHKRAKNHTEIKRALQLRQPGESYAKITKMLGSSRVLCQCYDYDDKKNEFKKVERICTIRGSMRKRVWMKPDDIVLISLREFTSTENVGTKKDKGDVIWKYKPEEVAELSEKNQLPLLTEDYDTNFQDNLDLGSISDNEIQAVSEVDENLDEI